MISLNLFKKKIIFKCIHLYNIPIESTQNATIFSSENGYFAIRTSLVSISIISHTYKDLNLWILQSDSDLKARFATFSDIFGHQTRWDEFVWDTKLKTSDIFEEPVNHFCWKIVHISLQIMLFHFCQSINIGIRTPYLFYRDFIGHDCLRSVGIGAKESLHSSIQYTQSSVLAVNQINVHTDLNTPSHTNK